MRGESGEDATVDETTPAEDAEPTEEIIPAEEPAADAMPMVAGTEEPDWSASTPERAGRYIADEAGLSPEEVQSFVDLNIKEAQKDLDKISGKGPKMTTSLSVYQKKKEHEDAVAEVQSKLDYWNAVKAEIGKGAEADESGEVRAERFLKAER